MTDELMKADNETRAFIEAVSLVEGAGWVVLRPEQVATPAQTKGDDLELVEALLVRHRPYRKSVGRYEPDELCVKAASRIQSLTASNEALERERDEARDLANKRWASIDTYQTALQAAQAEVARMREALQEARDMAWGAELNDRTAAVLRILDTALTPKEPT